MPYSSEIGDHNNFGYPEVDDVDEMHVEIAGRGAIIRAAPADSPGSMREMAVATRTGTA